jgi:hypothetical protein
MAAATQTPIGVLDQSDTRIVVAVRLSAMTSDQLESVNFAADSRFPLAVPKLVRMEIVSEPSARCVLQMVCNKAASTLVQSTALSGQAAVAGSLAVPVRVYTEIGGDITGAVVDIIAEFGMYSTGGLINGAARAVTGVAVTPPYTP